MTPIRSLPAGYPHPTSPAARRTMLANRRRDTGPELQLRSLLHRHGLRFRRDYPVRLEGRTVRVDVAFTRQRLAVFVDGCFWYGCPDHGSVPVANRGYWGPKLARNTERDREVDEALFAAGWAVLRFWEHTPPHAAAEAVRLRLSNRAAAPPASMVAGGGVPEVVAEPRAPNVNTVTLVGQLTADPELRQLPDGGSVCDLRLAVNDQKDQPPLYIDVATFGKSADACAQYLSKGRQVAVTGRLVYTQWQAKDGGKRSKHQVVGRVTFGARDLSAGNQASGGGKGGDE